MDSNIGVQLLSTESVQSRMPIMITTMLRDVQQDDPMLLTVFILLPALKIFPQLYPTRIQLLQVTIRQLHHPMPTFQVRALAKGMVMPVIDTLAV